MTEITTWQDAMNFTFRTRYSWKHGSGAVPTRINCNHFTDFAGADYPLVEITRKFLKSYQLELEDQEIAVSTINRRLSPVTTALNHLYDEEMIDWVPPRVKQYKESEGRPWFFTKEEVDELCAITSPRLSELIRFASCTGGRVSELLSVKAKDVDLESNQIYFGGRPGFNTKNGDWRSVPIAEPIRDMITSRCTDTPSDVLIFGDEWINPTSVRWYFKKACKQIGKESHYVFHSLRHSFATWNVEAGTPMRVLMDLMGHKVYKTTLRYGKATDKARTNALSSVFG